MSKCRSCGEAAVVDLPRHNANFCATHLQQLCVRQVQRAISDFSMFDDSARILVAVSGGTAAESTGAAHTRLEACRECRKARVRLSGPRREGRRGSE